MSRVNLLLLLVLVSCLPAFVFAAHHGVVLNDSTKIYATAFDTKSKAIDILNTGDTIEISDIQEKPGQSTDLESHWYKTITNSDAGWIDGRNLFVFEEDQLFQSFINGTQPAGNFLRNTQGGLSTDEEAKLQVLDSVIFYKREAHNRDSKLMSKMDILTVLWSDQLKIEGTTCLGCPWASATSSSTQYAISL